MDSKYNIIYIAGYGRSGSTLLDRLLGTSKEVFSSGELVHIFRAVAGEYNTTCGCGKKHEECPFWSGIIGQLKKEIQSHISPEQFIVLMKKIESIIPYKITKEEYDIYFYINKLLFDLIHKKSGAIYIVDSSKTAWMHCKRPIMLNKMFNDIKIIHLKRKACATTYSNIKDYYGADSRKKPIIRKFRFFKTVLSWISANKCAEKACTLSDNCLKIEYEDFFNDIDKGISQLNSFLNLSNQISKDKINMTNHIFTGNAVRNKLIKQFKVDNLYKTGLSFDEKLICKTLNFILRRKIFY